MLSEGSIVAICTCAATIATLYFQNKKNAEQSKATAKENAESSKARSADLKDTIDGKVSKLIQTVEEKGVLKEELAASKATAEEKEKGEAKATLTALQHDAKAAARALPPTDAQLVNGGKEQPDQSTRIETTGVDTNVRVQKVETVLGDRVDEVEEKLDEKQDK